MGKARGWKREGGGTSLIRKKSPPSGFHMALGIVLLQGPRGARFLMGEVPV